MNNMFEYCLSEEGTEKLFCAASINVVACLLIILFVGVFEDNNMLSAKEAAQGVWKTKGQVFLEKKTSMSTNLQEIEEKQKAVAVSIAAASDKTNQLSETKDRLTLLENQVQWLMLENAKLKLTANPTNE